MLFMPDCKKTSRLVSESMDRPLPIFKRLMVGIHLRMCQYCHRFEHQLRTLQAISRHINQHLASTESSVSLPEAARERIRHALRAQTKDA